MKLTRRSLLQYKTSLQCQKIDDVSPDGADIEIVYDAGQIQPSLRVKCESIINKTTTDLGMTIHDITWVPDRMEVIIANFPVDSEGISKSPDPEELSKVHRLVYDQFELDQELATIPERFEVSRYDQVRGIKRIIGCCK